MDEPLIIVGGVMGKMGEKKKAELIARKKNEVPC